MCASSWEQHPPADNDMVRECLDAILWHEDRERKSGSSGDGEKLHHTTTENTMNVIFPRPCCVAKLDWTLL